ncbi:TonB-dependent receptor [Glycocaulis abyssi]|uniref:TonB-dependent receptor n=1 Tax=Glycocaulis abyssi TaxID=1433403 RepID=UPI00352B86D0
MRIRNQRLLGVSGLVLALGFSALGAEALAQHQLTGRVVDERGNGLPGARVSVPELGLTTSTDRRGEFIFLSLPAGEAQLEVNYLGLPPGVRGVNISASETNTITFTLAQAGDGVERIVITGQILDSAARALNQQRTNSATTNIVSADSIGRFPDANIAEALQRVPGFAVARDQGEGRFINLRGAPGDFTGISVDGVAVGSPDPGTRAVDLDTIPADIVAALEVSKTLLPNQDADSIAGSVNLVTRSPFDRPGLRISGQGGLSYNEFGDGNDRRASGTISNTFGDGRFGALLSASYSRTDRQVDNIESNWIIEDVGGQDVFLVDEQEFKDYDTVRERTALTGSLEFRPDDANRFFLTGSYSRFRDNEFRNTLLVIYDDGDLQPGATNGNATWNDARIEKELRHRIVQNEIATIQIGGEHLIGGGELDYSLSYSRSEQFNPRRAQFLFRSSIRPDLSYDFSNADSPALSLFTTNEHLDLSGYGFRENVFRGQTTEQDEIAARINYAFSGSLFANPTEFRTGAAVRSREVTNDNEQYRDRRASANPGQPISAFLGTERSQNFNYFLGNKYDPSAVTAYWNANQAQSTQADVRRVPQSTTADYEAEERIYAAYGMATVEAGATRIVAGLRVEHTQFEGSAPFIDDADNISINRISRDYTNWFPNLTVRHEFSDNLIGRVALTRAISRPRYQDVVPRVEEGDRTSLPVEVDRGNPDLRETLSNNFDAGLEYYFTPLGLAAINVFYKDLENYEFELVRDGTYEGLPARISTAENAPDGYIRGVELTYQQQFVNLPGLLANTGVFANYTYTDAEITLASPISGSRTRVLPGQSDTTLNLAVFYETERFSARLSWNDRSDYIDSVDGEDSRLDIFWEGRSQLDFSASYDVNDQLGVFFEAKNLTNTEGVRYAGDRSRVIEREAFGYTLFGGLRFNF